jgi:hypothetical protein
MFDSRHSLIVEGIPMNTKFTAVTGTRVINVSLPHQIFDLEQVQKITANLMTSLGHQTCFSGFDIRFMYEDDFRVNPGSLAVHPAALP